VTIDLFICKGNVFWCFPYPVVCELVPLYGSDGIWNKYKYKYNLTASTFIYEHFSRNKQIIYTGFQVRVVVNMTSVFWEIMPCSLEKVNVYREYIPSMCFTLILSSVTLWPWRWKQYISSKHHLTPQTT
jgi:hypothetical protein